MSKTVTAEQTQEEKRIQNTLEDVNESLLNLEDQLTGLEAILETVSREYTDTRDREEMLRRVMHDPARLHTLTRMMWDYLTTARDEVLLAQRKAAEVLEEEKRGA